MKNGREVLAAVCLAPNEPFRFERVTLDDCRDDEVIVRIAAVGLCHTDLAIRDGLSPIPPFPSILGHEGAGIVEEIGRKVTRFKPDDRVVLSFTCCGHCGPCLRQTPSQCERFVEANLRGTRADGSHTHHWQERPVSGNYFGQSSFATHALVEERNLVRVPEDIPLAILAPLGCGVQTGAGTVLNRLKPEAGSSLLVFGAGTVGLAAVMAGNVCGCAPIIAVDLDAGRLEKAKEFGATHTLVAGSDDVVTQIIAITQGGAQHVVEACGAAPAVGHAIRSVRKGGAVCLLGFTPPEARVTIPVSALTMGSIQVVVEGDSVPQTFIPRLIALYREGRFPFDRLISCYEFSDLNIAAADSLSGKVIKPVLRVGAATP